MLENQVLGAIGKRYCGTFRKPILGNLLAHGRRRGVTRSAFKFKTCQYYSRLTDNLRRICFRFLVAHEHHADERR